MTDNQNYKQMMVQNSWIILILTVLVGLLSGQWMIDRLNEDPAFNLEYSIGDKKGPNLSTYEPLANFNLEFDTYHLPLIMKENRPENIAKEYYWHGPMLNASMTDNEKQQAEEDLNELLTLPLYYHNKTRNQLSTASLANEYRYKFQALEPQFSWYERGKSDFLFYEDHPYSGWYLLPFQGLSYFSNGSIKNTPYNLIESKMLIQKFTQMNRLIPSFFYTSSIFEREQPFNYEEQVKPRNYSILFKNDKQLILTQPPGNGISDLVSNTENFIDVPLEVVGEVETPEGDWLHVNVGYNELGWVLKDPTLQNYVTTYYSERELLDNIAYVLRENMYNIYADIGASFVDAESMAQVSVNSHKFFPASTQKIYVLGELYRQYANGELSPDDMATLYEHNRVPGAGVVQGYSEGSQFTLDYLVDLVTTISDNTAANILITMVGGGEVINPHLHQMDLKETFVTGKYYHFDETYFRTSPADAARYFAFLARHQLNGEPYDSQLIDKFRMNTHTYVRSYMYSIPSWNKSGSGETEQNDVATFNTQYGDYSLAVYTANPAYYFDVPDQVAALSYQVYQVYMDIRSDLFISVEDPVALTNDPDYYAAQPKIPVETTNGIQ